MNAGRFSRMKWVAVWVIFAGSLQFASSNGHCAGSNPVILHSFAFGAADGSNTWGDLTCAPDGHTLYGMTKGGGGSGYGTIFSYDTGNSTFSLLHSFAGGAGDGSMPQGSITLSADGKILYGMTYFGGAGDCGTIFRYDTVAHVFQLLHSFAGGANDGQCPSGSLTLSTDGHTLYGMTPYGGSGGGTLFRYDLTNNSYQVLHGFAGGAGDGSVPFGSLTLSGDGQTLYGMTFYGGTGGKGTIFSYGIGTQTFQLLHSFGTIISGLIPDGCEPYGSLTLSVDGHCLYGMTSNCSSNGSGSIFQFTLSDNTMVVLHAFAGGANDGEDPSGSLALSADGLDLYGMSIHGGAGYGMIFKFSVGSHIFQALHAFSGGTGAGNMPNGSPILSWNGNTLFGMSGGGGGGGGTIFSVDLGDNSLNLLHNFSAMPTDAIWPAGSPTVLPDGITIYGLTPQGGTGNVGAMFRYNAATHAYTLLRSITLDPADPWIPVGSFTPAAAGNILYGVSTTGGDSPGGTIFSYDPGTNTLQRLHSFDGAHDGSSPQGALTLSLSGTTLYGMTYSGGGGKGTIFSYAPGSNTFQVLHSFAGGTNDGAWPQGSLTLSADGHTLYGMTNSGGDSDFGAIFSYAPASNTFQLLYNFTGGASDGSSPQGSLTLSADGHTLYGLTPEGGGNGLGTMFSYDADTDTFQLLHSFAGGANDGSSPQGSLTLSSDGRTLYGMTSGGGAGNCGTIFSYGIDTHSLQLQYSFAGGPNDGGAPRGSFNLSPDGNTLYGLTSNGGSYNDGVIFSFDVARKMITSPIQLLLLAD